MATLVPNLYQSFECAATKPGVPVEAKNNGEGE